VLSLLLAGRHPGANRHLPATPTPTHTPAERTHPHIHSSPHPYSHPTKPFPHACHLPTRAFHLHSEKRRPAQVLLTLNSALSCFSFEAWVAN
jgi:hypothetical protein